MEPEMEKNRKCELDSFPSEPNMQQECEGVGLAHSVGLGHPQQHWSKAVINIWLDLDVCGVTIPIPVHQFGRQR